MNARVVSSLLALGLVTLSSTSFALPGVDVGVGLVGLGGASFITKSSDSGPGSETYPGFVGLRTGIGANLELRVLGVVGIEAGFIKSNDKGKGDINVAGYNVSAELGQTATHIPVLVKLVLPIPFFAPFVGAGIDFVKPGDCSSSFSGGGVVTPTTCHNANYSMWTGAVGAELALPIPGIDLRIPLSLRYSRHRDFGDSISERASFVVDRTGIVNKIDFRSEWQHETYATAGVSLFF